MTIAIKKIQELRIKDKEVEEIDIKALQKDHPELFGEGSKYVKRKLKKARSGYVRITR